MSASKWKPYPKYRAIPHVGIEKIPNHWDSKRVRYVFRERGEVSEDGNEELLSVSKYTGVKVRSTTTDREARAASLVGYKKCEPNDIVSNIMLAWDSALGVAFDSGIVSSAYEVYVPQQEIDPHFLDLLLRTPEYRVAFTIVSKGIVPSRWRMYTESFNDIQMTLPPLNEQKQIGSFVHRINENISRNIENIENQISILEEKRSALITQAVTKGINPNVPMKDSGVEWIGRVPEHWTIKKVKYLAEFVNGFAFDSNSFVDEGVPIIRIGDIAKSVNWEKTKKVPHEIADSTREYQLQLNDIVVALTGATVGKSAIYQSTKQALVNQRVAIIRTNDNIQQQLLLYSIQSDYVMEQIKLLSYGGAQGNISHNDIAEIFIPVPAIEEQMFISKFILEAEENITKILNRIYRLITRLNEYRTTLVSSAVTGKIDVRESV